MKSLFDPITIGKLSLKNRVIRSATLEAAQDKSGNFSDELCRIYGALAKGNVAAVITGMMGVDENARLFPKMVDTQAPNFIPELKKVCDLIHADKCACIVQISHCGLQANVLGSTDRPLAPSEIEPRPGVRTKAMTKEDIAAVVKAFAETAARCREAGADGVQIHGAHGYLLSQFLAPIFNKRTDEYGGDIAGRGRIVLEVYDAVRKEVGPDFAVWIKINSTDGAEPSITPEEFVWICKELDKRGIDAIEVSGGLGISKKSTPSFVIKEEKDEGSFADAALALADAVGTSVISVGGYRTLSRLEEWLNKGKIAAIAMSRPLISEPGLIKRWQDGDLRKARCISCNKCFMPKGKFGCQAFED